mmetsp:Transcript_64492/g.107176  ORF Transcript_64492/g.107176 Transcript_64492/m.107176 type:complete len:149 (+) Transcript_64492:111-557(+)|eukprot:CAMPEP_0119305122 /NCGR_PEP_ID=MMETSP1333-20130426/6195_1 /TAXON_ID=418940 /ORGANISM="Scyphosphaera apsteinii, Strain RCC1455" /LENGTH=148 /DNA_ID=CAMNT_0007308143 /DNA_START=243 /DNA_END=689 /DNA_ORIENTATION=-
MGTLAELDAERAALLKFKRQIEAHLLKLEAEELQLRDWKQGQPMPRGQIQSRPPANGPQAHDVAANPVNPIHPINPMQGGEPTHLAREFRAELAPLEAPSNNPHHSEDSDAEREHDRQLLAQLGDDSPWVAEIAPHVFASRRQTGGRT